MSKNRAKTNLIHNSNGESHEVMREKATGQFFVKNTDIQVSSNQVSKSGGNYKGSQNQADNEEGDEWSDYCWSADDY